MASGKLNAIKRQYGLVLSAGMMHGALEVNITFA
jgi:hypothetical protein